MAFSFNEQSALNNAGFANDRLLQGSIGQQAKDQINLQNTAEAQRLASQLAAQELAQKRDLFARENEFNQDFGLRQDEFGFQERQFDVGQQNRTALLEQLGLATPGGPAGEGFAEGSIFDNLLSGGGQGQGFTDLLNEQRAAKESLMGQIGDFGASQRSALDRTFDVAQNNAVANLEGRGLGASNLLGSATAQVAAERNQAGLELEDQLLGRRLDAVSGANQGIFDTQTGQLERENQQRLQGISTIGQLTGGLI